MFHLLLKMSAIISFVVVFPALPVTAITGFWRMSVFTGGAFALPLTFPLPVPLNGTPPHLCLRHQRYCMYKEDSLFRPLSMKMLRFHPKQAASFPNKVELEER